VWRVINGDGPILGVHEASPGCEVGQRIQAHLEDIDRRALTAVETELETTTLADLAAEAQPAAAA
jgi:hypothetical protein